MTFGTTLGDHLAMAASANMKIAANNINIKIHQLFSKQRILGVSVTIEQWKISVDLTRTCS